MKVTLRVQNVETGKSEKPVDGLGSSYTEALANAESKLADGLRAIAITVERG